MCFSIANWLFVLKYWSLSFKMRELIHKQSEQRWLNLAWYLQWGFICVVIILAATCIGIYYAYFDHDTRHERHTLTGISTAAYIASFSIDVLPCIWSLLFLLDAFWRMSKIDLGTAQTLDKRQIIITILVFVAIVVS